MPAAVLQVCTSPLVCVPASHAKLCCSLTSPMPSTSPAAAPQLLELASLLHAYGLVSAVPTFPPAPTAPLSPDSRRQAARARAKSAPKLNPDGSVRLNARQRRTLRRAQERAMKALLEAQTKAHGITSEQVGTGRSERGGPGRASEALGDDEAPAGRPCRLPPHHTP